VLIGIGGKDISPFLPNFTLASHNRAMGLRRKDLDLCRGLKGNHITVRSAEPVAGVKVLPENYTAT